MRWKEDAACEAVGAPANAANPRRIANGRRVACRWKRPPIDTRRARCPHAGILAGLRLGRDGRTRVPKAMVLQWIAESHARGAGLEQDVL